MNSKETKQLETSRLMLRKLLATDVEDVFNNWTSDPEVSKYVTWNAHKSSEETKKLVNYWINDYNNDYTYRWGIILKETGELIGSIDVIHKDIQYKTCEVGYCFGSKWWNNGYATESLKAVIEYLHESGFSIVTAQHFKSNPASGKVMGKAGMIYEAILHSRVINKDGNREDVLVYYSSIEDNKDND